MEYVDQNRNVSISREKIGRLGLFKHLAVAGQGYLPSLRYYTRVAGIIFQYIEYMNRGALSANRFSEPPASRRDPTEKGHFSNLVGKGIGDFLAKRLSGAKITHSYEAAMTLAGIKIQGRRPDLYCLGEKVQFAAEAKGYAAGSISAMEMLKYKNQAMSGPLPVNFSIASVSFNLYERVCCKYYDPFDRAVEFNSSLNSELNRLYYSGIYEYLDYTFFRIEEGEIHNRQCFFIDIIGHGTPFSISFGDWNLALILQSNFKRFTIKESTSFNETTIQEPGIYLDTDGIGFCMRRFASK